MPTVRPLAASAALTLALAACASSGGRRPEAPAPNPRVEASIARLEHERDDDPKSARVLRALGIAYYEDGRYEDARHTLEAAQRLAPIDGAISLYLGLSAEQLGDLEAARAAYTTYLKVGRARRVRAELEARLTALSRRELQVEARQALANEAQIAQVPSSPRTIAVLPLDFHGTDSTLVPLERGLADLLITDLGRSAQLTIVERDRMAALLEEIRRSQSGQVDSATRLRAGRLVRAGRVIQGAITEMPGHTLRIDAAVVDVPSAQALQSVDGSDPLDRLFALEKQIAFGVFDALGVTLTPSERQLVEQRPTRSIAAFLAYSSGLMAEDNGNLDDANRYFQQASRMDPGFAAARTHAQQVQATMRGSAVTPTRITQSLRGTTEGQIAAAAAGGTAAGDATSMASTIAEGLNPPLVSDPLGGAAVPSRDAAAATTGTDNPTRGTAHVVIVVHQPPR